MIVHDIHSILWPLRGLIFALVLLVSTLTAAAPAAPKPQPGTQSSPLVITYRLDSAPIQFKNSLGEADGILIDFWKLWSEKANIPVIFKGAFNKQSQAMVADGTADINAGIFENDTRKKHMDFSSPIINSPYHLYIHQQINHQISDDTLNLQNLGGVTVGVTRGSFHESYLREHYPNASLALYDGYQALFKAANDGLISAFVSQPMYRAYYLRQQALAEKFHPLSPALYNHSYRAGVAKQQPQLLKTINQHIANISVEEKSIITRKWLGIQWHTDQDKRGSSISLNEEEKKWISEHPVIRMGGESNWAPFEFADEQGRYQGITADYVELLQQRLGLRFEMHYNQSWPETLDRLKTGKLDAVAAISVTPEREKYALFTSPYATYPYVIITHEKNTHLDSLQSLEGKRVAVENGFYTHQTLSERYPEIQLSITNSTEAAIELVSQGKTDAYIGVQPVASYYMDKLFITNLRVAGLAPFEKVGIGMAVRANAPILGQLLQKGLDSMSPAEKLAIQRKWLSNSRANHISRRIIKLSDEQKAWISTHPSIRVGVDPSWPPIEYFDDRGVYSGIASDYVRLFESTFKVKAEYDSSLSWAEVIKRVKEGRIDVLPAVSITPQREQYLNFTEPYLRFPYVIFMRHDAQLITGLNELTDKTIVVERNYANHELLKSNHPEIKLLLVDDTEQALSALSLGDADAYMGNLAATSHIILQTGRTNIKVAAPTPYSNDLAFAVRKDLRLLPDILQAFLNSVTVEQSNAFKKRWFSIQYEHLMDYALLWKSIGISLFVLFLVSLWLWLLNRQKKALRISEERFRLVMNATREGIWDWDLPSDKVYYSPGFYSMLGYAENDFPGADGAWLDLLHPEDYEKTKNALNRIIDNRDTRYALEFRMKHKSGQYRDVQSMGSLVLDHLGNPVRSLGSLTDITDKKNAQKKLKQREQQLKAIIDTIPLVIIIANDDGNIVFANKQTNKEIGIKDGAVGLNMQSFYENPEDRKKLFTLYKENGRVDALPMRYKNTAGEINEGIISMMPVYFDGGIKNLGVWVNLTDRVNLERELVNAKVQADIANKTKSSFLANMSHEIRTPMNAIIGLSHLVLNTELNARAQDYITKIHSSAHALLGIINEILDFSKIEAGKLEIECTRFQLDDVLEKLSSLIALRVEEKGLEIVFSVDPDISDNLLGDPLRLGQVLTNLVQNAVKFTETGEILVEIRCLEHQANSETLEFSVTDTGIGIDSDEVQHLFEAFSQVDESYTRRFDGTGLGLAICQKLIGLMGGAISVDSTPEKGSRFSFELSFKTLDAGERPVTIDFTGKHALVVDDNDTARQAIALMLSSFAFTVHTAASGEQALQKIHEISALNQQHVDLVLLDSTLPGLSALATANKISETSARYKKPKIILLSTNDPEAIQQQAEFTEPDSFLVKPISPSMLFNCIIELLQDVPPSVDNDLHAIPDGRLIGRILLVEDNLINQLVAQEMLETMGLSVRVAKNGAKALTILEAEDFDVVITDIQMHEMDGFELTRCIRKQPQWQTLPVIAMTAHAMKGDREKCLAAGMNDHIPKPIESQHLFNVLEKWLPDRPLHKDRGDNLSRSTLTSPDTAAPAYSIPAQELQADLASIDIACGLGRIGGNKKLFYKLLKDFSQDYANSAQQIEQAIAADDYEQARRSIHTLLGIAGNICAKKLQQTAQELIISFNTHKQPESQLINHFLDAFNEVSKDVLIWLDTANSDYTGETRQDVTLDASLLDHIEHLLAEGNPEAVKLLARIELKSLSRDDANVLSRVLQNVQNYEFSQARTELSKLTMSPTKNRDGKLND